SFGVAEGAGNRARSERAGLYAREARQGLHANRARRPVGGLLRGRTDPSFQGRIISAAQCRPSVAWPAAANGLPDTPRPQSPDVVIPEQSSNQTDEARLATLPKSGASALDF